MKLQTSYRVETTESNLTELDHLVLKTGVKTDYLVSIGKMKRVIMDTNYWIALKKNPDLFKELAPLKSYYADTTLGETTGTSVVCSHRYTGGIVISRSSSN